MEILRIKAKAFFVFVNLIKWKKKKIGQLKDFAVNENRGSDLEDDKIPLCETEGFVVSKFKKRYIYVRYLRVKLLVVKSGAIFVTMAKKRDNEKKI